MSIKLNSLTFDCQWRILSAVGTGETQHTAVRPPARTGLFLVAFVAATLLGRIIIVEPASVGVVAPGPGVALVWLASSPNRRWFVIDAVLLSFATMVALLLSSGTDKQALISMLSVIQVVLTVLLLRRWVPQIWGAGGRRPMNSLGELGRVLAAIAIGTLLYTLLRAALGVLLIPEETWSMGIGRFGRSATAMATVGLTGLLLGGWLAEHRDRGVPPFNRPSRDDLLNAAGVLASSLAIFVLGFYLNPEIPSTFMLTLTVVWAAIRFNVVVAAAQCLLTGAGTVLMTIRGYGPIANVGDPESRALLAQVFVVVLMVTGMVIAVTRRQLFGTIERIERSEEVLRLRANELDMVMSHLDDAVAIIEEGGRVLHANEALLTAFGSKPAEPLERVPDKDEQKGQSFKPDGQPLTDEENPLNRALAGEVVEAEEIHSVDEFGVRRVLEVSAFQVPSELDAPKRVMIVIRDITAVSAHRDSLTSFAGTVAHDLNNPLSVIDGWAEALEEDLGESHSPDALAAVPMVQHIRASVDQMRAFISDLLAHAVSRDQSLHCETVPLRNLVKHIATTRDRPRNGGDIVAEGDLLDVWVDRVLLRQVLDNLIGNAFKYVAPGVVPRVTIDAEPSHDGWARVRVRDNGIGIPAAQRERVFDSFHRVGGEKYQGTGLGLAICKRVIQRHGGTIVVTDNPDGQGTCFEFTLPTTAEALARATMV
jgi:signal transduction histidine kinase/integral membrane sensor domain MASE1